MARASKIRLAAKLMVAKYGTAAPPIARMRARHASRQEDDAAVDTWKAIGRVAAAVLPRRKGAGEVALSDVLGAGVVRQILAADRVNREDVEHLMARTAHHRQQEEP
jgi:hypothetical protein